jgi:hypothetical protein
MKGNDNVNIEGIVKIIREYSILELSKRQFKDMDGYSRVLLSTALNDEIYSVQFTNDLVENDMKIFEFRKVSNLPYLVDGHITITACIYKEDNEFILKVLEFSGDNVGHEFKTEEEVINILTKLNLINNK